MTDPSALVAAAKPAVFWTDRLDAPSPNKPLQGSFSADLCIVGGGFTGLWAALQALEDNPGRSVVVLEAVVCGSGASSRNGGFCDPSLTHGFLNGLMHWPDEIQTLERLGRENLDDMLDAIDRFAIQADVQRVDEVSFATSEIQLEWQQDHADTLSAHGIDHKLLDQSAAQDIAHSPTYLGGLTNPGIALVDPARLAWGLRRAVERIGGVVYDHTRVTQIDADESRVRVGTEHGAIHAQRVIVATNAWAEPLRQMRRYIVPVYDHVLMTEPLSDAQMTEIGWSGREGLADAANQFHYYRLTADDRILWGGYDANYHWNNGMGPEFEQRTGSHEVLARHFFETFPQLEGLGFSHRWAGPIGTTSKFAAAFGTMHGDRLAWVGGYTGLGVAASRFGAGVALDLVDGLATERSMLEMVRRRPVPFPPEPLRSLAIRTTRNALAKQDETGETSPWLKVLDRFGVGFDS